MPINGSNKRPTEYVPTSPAVKNWVYLKLKSGYERILKMSIFEYRKLRFQLITLTTIDDESKVVAMGLIKPKDETKYLEINPNDSALKAYLKQRENETNNKQTD